MYSNYFVIIKSLRLQRRATFIKLNNNSCIIIEWMFAHKVNCISKVPLYSITTLAYSFVCSCYRKNTFSRICNNKRYTKICGMHWIDNIMNCLRSSAFWADASCSLIFIHYFWLSSTERYQIIQTVEGQIIYKKKPDLFPTKIRFKTDFINRNKSF